MQVFNATVTSILTSCLSVYVLSKTGFRMLSTAHTKMCRKLLGKSGTYLHEGQRRQLPSAKIHSMLGIPLLGTILRMQRLKFMQGILRRKSEHKLFLPVLLGTFGFQPHDHVESVECNKWLAQLRDDLAVLSDDDDMHWVVESLTTL